MDVCFLRAQSSCAGTELLGWAASGSVCVELHKVRLSRYFLFMLFEKRCFGGELWMQRMLSPWSKAFTV